LSLAKNPRHFIFRGKDYLVHKNGVIQTAECSSTSKLALIPGMGHIPFTKEILSRFENEIIQFINLSRCTI